MNALNKNGFYKFSILTLIFVIIGLPINSIEYFIILIISLPIIIYSKIYKNVNFFKIIIILLLFVFIKILLPTLKIQEGHNLIILNTNTHDYYEKNLPKEVFKFVKNKYASFYNNSTCKLDDRRNCWENYDIKQKKSFSSFESSIYAKSSDWNLNKIKYSRILNNINFTNLKTARIENINNTDFNFFWPSKFDVVRENIPFFTMIEIPKELMGSSLCWKGYTFWQNKNNKYDKKFNSELKCSKILAKNINKKIFGVSFGGTVSIERLNELYTDKFVKINDNKLDQFLKNNELTLTLKKNFYLLSIELAKLILTIIVTIYLLYKFFIFDYKILLFSVIFSSLFVLVSFFVHEDLFNGFTVYTGGNDGILYSTYASQMFEFLQNFNLYEFLRGVENVFYYMPGLRYFLALNKIFFGESLYGYLIVAFFYPIVIFHILELLIGKYFAIFIVSFTFLTRAFEGYALSSYKILEHIKDNDSEPLAIVLFLFCLYLFLKKFIKANSNDFNSMYYFTFGFLLFFVTAVRPNFLPGTFCLSAYMTIYLYITEKNIKYAMYTLLGYAFIFLLPLHNYYFGKELAFFTRSGVTLYSYITIETWFSFAIDIITFDFNNITDKYTKIFKQIYIWIKPNEIHYLITFFITLLVILLKNNFYIKFICIICLLQHLVCLYILPHGRYAYLAWTLTIIINFYFMRMLYNYLKEKRKERFG